MSLIINFTLEFKGNFVGFNILFHLTFSSINPYIIHPIFLFHCLLAPNFITNIEIQK